MPPQPGFYTKKPVTIQAIQFTDANRDALTAWLTAELAPALWRIKPCYVEIETLEGPRDCWLGYWIVKGTRGEFYPVRPDVFADVYEPAGESCAAEYDRRGAWPWLCTLPAGHEDDHEAHGIDREKPFMTWPREVTS